ncbi:hypothetical protein BKA15_006005 [Microlunatus parietis]|uniref:PKD domain-containing protein n=1 Tax=Microlunatus parietis TaxID=682979 RepID=A0A7Y9IDN3_9ACTN|nr:hypothetical protein [Microlunatus parietis]
MGSKILWPFVLAILCLTFLGPGVVDAKAEDRPCPNGTYKRVHSKTGEVTCVAGTRQPDRDNGGDSWTKPGVPDDSDVRTPDELPEDRSEWTWSEVMYYSDPQPQCWGINDPAAYVECQATQWATAELTYEEFVEEIAQEVISRIRFTAATPMLGPDRTQHGYPFDTAVGFPIWLWTEGGTESDSVVERSGPLTVSVSVRLTEVAWDLGDGTKLRCNRGTSWRPGIPAGKPSPSCGHIYTSPGVYNVVATSRWELAWSAGGESGVTNHTIAVRRTFEVGEIHVLVR